MQERSINCELFKKLPCWNQSNKLEDWFYLVWGISYNGKRLICDACVTKYFASINNINAC
jgi:hypothetical protein